MPSRRGRLSRGAFVGLQVAAAVITIAVVAIGILDHDFGSQHGQPVLREGKQIVVFRQLANRICTENTQNMKRARVAARSPIELLAFLSRAISWDVGDLAGVTPPPSRAAEFAAEVSSRRRIAGDLLDLQRAVETGDMANKASAVVKLKVAKTRSAELGRSLGLERCTMVLPPLPRGLTS